jgi:hypothetical protein
VWVHTTVAWQACLALSTVLGAELVFKRSRHWKKNRSTFNTQTMNHKITEENCYRHRNDEFIYLSTLTLNPEMNSICIKA